VSFASFGGWIPFGPERIITKSEANILYELTGNLHLICIKNLGDKAKLPQASLYPLNVVPVGKRTVVRTILNINEDQSMTLAGDVPMNSREFNDGFR
jgi:hypothetical protein